MNTRRVYVLVGDEQVPLSPQDVAEVVTSLGFKTAAERYGYSETTLRGFLAENGFVARKNVTYEKTPHPPRLNTAPQNVTGAGVGQLGG